MTARFLLDVDAIERRALAAPGGQWDAWHTWARVPWSDPADEQRRAAPASSGRYLVVQDNEWHTGCPDPGIELFGFLAAARGDVLTLITEVRRQQAEVQRLRAALAASHLRPLERAA